MANMETHGENLERVSQRIAPAVKRFCWDCLCLNPTGEALFHADDLRNYVTDTTGINAPASADRVLRQLRLSDQLNYVVVSRRESLYRVLWVRGFSSEQPEVAA